MAGEKVQAPTDPMAGINAMLTTLGGTKTTTSPGNTAQLEQAIAGMRAQDPAAMLQSIFQQAGAQIPGIQSALGRSIGARSSSNSAVNAALQKLLSQTTISAQDQLVKQQLAQLQAQVPAAAEIARTTQGTTKSTGTDLGEASKNLAILQLLSKSGILEKLGLGEAAKSVTGAAPAQATGPMQGPAPAAAAPMTSAAPMASTEMAGAMTPTQFPDLFMSGNASYDIAPSAITPPTNLDMFNLSPVNAGPAATNPVAYGDVIPGLEEWVIPTTDTYNEFYADGGLIGRDGKKAPMEPEDDKDDTAEALANARFDAGFTANEVMDSFRKLLGDSLGKSNGYADGGVISAPGSRRSSNPTITPDVITGTGANTGNSLSLAPLAGTIPVPTVASSNPNKMLMPQAGSQEAATFGLGGMDSGSTGTPAGSFSPLSASTRGSLQTAAQLNSLSGLTGGPSLPGFGLAAGLLSAPTAADAAKIGLTAAGNAISPGLGSIAGFAMNPSLSSGINAISAFNPISAIANLGLSLTGNATLGEIAQNIADKMSPNNPMAPAQMQAASDFGLGLTGGAVDPNTGLQGSGLGDQTGLYGDAGVADSGVSANSVGSGSGYMADGGKIKGAGTGISDSIPIKASKGEYMMSKDVVDTLGVEFFDALQAAFHTPAAIQRMRAA